MIRIIIGILLMIMGSIVILFFRNYQGDTIPYPSLFRNGGYLLNGLGLLIVILTARSMKKKQKQKKADELYDFKNESTKHSIDSNLCEVRSSDYQIEGDETGKWQKASVATYSTDQFGEMKTFLSPRLEIEKLNLEMKLSLGTEVNLYVHNENPEKYLLEVGI